MNNRSFFIRTFLSGFFLALPIIILVAVVIFLVRLVINLITPIAKILSPGADVTHWSIQLLAFFIVLGIFFLLGLIVNVSTGKRAFSFIERVFLERVPFYNTIKNIVEQLRGKDQPFKEVVLCDPHNSGALMTGFIVEEIDDEKVIVYVPTAPNPTNGYVFHMNRKDLIATDAKTQEAIASVIGMGVGSKKIYGSKKEESLEA